MVIGVIFLVVLGGILGWLASVVLRAESARAILANVGVGIAGAFLAAAVLNPLVGVGNILGGSYGAKALLLAVLGSIALLTIVNMLRRGAWD